MTWTHIKANHPLMLIEQWVYRTKTNVPACALKRGERPGDYWQACILNHNGISTVLHYIAATSPEDAKEKSEVLIREKGWK